MGRYRYLTGSTVDPTEIREELPLAGVSYGEALNGHGAAAASISLTHAKATEEVLSEASTALYIERGGLIVWGGILWTTDPDTATDNLGLGASGFLSYFDHRTLNVNKTYTGDPLQGIARDLIDTVQGETGGSIGVVVDPAFNAEAVAHDRTWKHFERKNVGQLLSDMTRVEGGFDHMVEVSNASGSIVRTYKTFYPFRGRRSETVWATWPLPGLGGSGAAIRSVKAPRDATRMALRVHGIGEGEGEAMLLSTQADPSLIGPYPILEDVVTYKSVKRQTTLDAHARADLARLRVPVRTVTVELNTRHPEAQIGSFGCGDYIELRVARGYLVLSGLWRVLSWQVTVGNNEEETLVVTLGQEASL